ncbi:hypothetical protein BHM03_00029518, partial [Ensete ventricosum]
YCTSTDNMSVHRYGPVSQTLLHILTNPYDFWPASVCAGIVERYNRPMPKLRSSREEAGASGQKPLPPGTLSVEQVRQIILLHQGKAVEHPGPMDIQDIANKFGVDAAQVQQITRFMSLPPQDGERKTQ